MKYLAAFFTWLLTPTYADFTSNPIGLWIQIVCTGVFYALIYMGLTGLYTYYRED